MRARCYCGAVEVNLGHQVSSFINCHCGMCRRLSGCAYTSWLCVPKGNVAVMSGQEHIKTVAVSKHSTNRFCMDCGTRVYTEDTRYESVMGIPAGIVDGLDASLTKECYYDNRAVWAMHQSHLPNDASCP